MNKLNPDALATILGLLVAIANAWVNIEWEHFEFSPNNIIKIGISAVIAAGGYMSTIKSENK